jgi:hypothetical protein
MTTKSKLMFAPLVLLCVALVACGNPVVDLLESGVIASEAAVAYASTPGIADGQTIAADAQAAATALSSCISIFESASADAVKYATCGSTLAGVVLSTAGLSSGAANQVRAIEAAVNAVIAAINAAQNPTSPAGNSFAAKAKKISTKLSKSDRAKLDALKARADKTAAQAAALKGKK